MSKRVRGARLYWRQSDDTIRVWWENATLPGLLNSVQLPLAVWDAVMEDIQEAYGCQIQLGTAELTGWTRVPNGVVK